MLFLQLVSVFCAPKGALPACRCSDLHGIHTMHFTESHFSASLTLSSLADRIIPCRASIVRVVLFALHCKHPTEQYFSLKCSIYPFVKSHWSSLALASKSMSSLSYRLIPHGLFMTLCWTSSRHKALEETDC